MDFGEHLPRPRVAHSRIVSFAFPFFGVCEKSNDGFGNDSCRVFCRHVRLTGTGSRFTPNAASSSNNCSSGVSSNFHTGKTSLPLRAPLRPHPSSHSASAALASLLPRANFHRELWCERPRELPFEATCASSCDPCPDCASSASIALDASRIAISRAATSRAACASAIAFPAASSTFLFSSNASCSRSDFHFLLQRVHILRAARFHRSLRRLRGGPSACTCSCTINSGVLFAPSGNATPQ